MLFRALRTLLCVLLCVAFGFASFGCGTAAVIATETSADDEDRAIRELAASLESREDMAHIITDSNILHRRIAIVFEGAVSESMYIRLLDMLDEHKVKATFFVSGITAAELPETLQLMAERGHAIGNYCLSGETHIEALSGEEMVRTLYRTQRIIMGATGQIPSMARCNVTTYTDEVLRAASASGVANVVAPGAYINHSSFKSEAQAKSFANKTVWGQVISIKLGQELDDSEFLERGTDLDEKPAEDMQPTVQATPVPVELPEDENERLLLTLEWLFDAYDALNMGYATPVELDLENDVSLVFDYASELLSGETASELLSAPINRVNTIAKEVSLVFTDFADDDTMYAVLDALDERGAKANFVVTAAEMLDRNELLKRMIVDGHYLVNGGFSGNSLDRLDYNGVCGEIMKGASYLKTEYGVSGAAYCPVFAYADDTVLRACANRAVIPFTYNRHPRPEYADSVDSAMEYFKHGVNRGDIIVIKADCMRDIAEYAGRIVDLIHDTGYETAELTALYDTRYEVTPLEEIEGWDAALVSADYDEKAKIADYALDHIPVPGNEKVMFITFDDYGGDKTITKILDVLDEYDVKASFFLRAAGVELNPSLARAMSDAGHDVCNHTYSHPIITDLTPEQLQEEVVKAHQVITAAIGRCPEMYFRPPTLASDTSSINAVLATGYKYVLQATISTQDYERTADEVVDFAIDNAGSGRMVIMHLTDNSSGADALARLIEELTKKGYKLAKISDYLPDYDKNAE